MASERGKYAHNFKRVGAAVGVDRRALRAHHRSINQKESRGEVVARRRDIGPSMSPLPEARTDDARPTASATNANDDKPANRKAQLLKWKKEKELRQKVEELEKARKKPFRVVHVEQEIVAFKKALIPLAKLPHAHADLSIAPSIPPKAPEEVNEKEVTVKTRQTRKRGLSVKERDTALSTTTAAYATRSKSVSSSAPLGNAAANTKEKVDLVGQNTQGTSKAEAKAAKKTSGTGKGKTAVKTKQAAQGRTTRLSSAVSAAAAAAAASAASDTVSTEANPTAQWSVSRLGKVTMKRGAESFPESFAPIDFQFTAPENLAPFSFDKPSTSSEILPTDDKLESPRNSRNSTSAVSSDRGRSSRKSRKMSLAQSVVSDLQMEPDTSGAHGSSTVAAIKDCFVLIEKFDKAVVGSHSVDARQRPTRKSVAGDYGRRKPTSKQVLETREDAILTPEMISDAGSVRSARGVESYQERKTSRRKSTRNTGKDLDLHLPESFDDAVAMDEIKVSVGARGRRSVMLCDGGKIKGGNRRSILQSVYNETSVNGDDCAIGSSSVESRRPVQTLDLACGSTDGGHEEVITNKSSKIEKDINNGQTEVKASRRKSVRRPTANVETDDEKDVYPVVDEPEPMVRGKAANRSNGIDDITFHTPKRFEVVTDSEQVKTDMLNSRRKSAKKSTTRANIDNDSSISGAVKEQNARKKAAKETDVSEVEDGESKSLPFKGSVEENEVKKAEVMDNVFQTPNQLTRSVRSRSVAVVPKSSQRKTPKNVRSSLILRTLSPEEGVEILKNSPMIEMNRRKIRSPNSSSVAGSDDGFVAPMPNFDDVEGLDDVFSHCKSESLNLAANVTTLLSSASEKKSPVIPASVLAESPPSESGSALEGASNEREAEGVKHFRDLLTSETLRLSALCKTWKETLATETDAITDDVSGQIRTTIGQAKLLIAQRFKQFSGLIDNCEFKTSEKEITRTDLEGFWEMIYFQVEDVNRKFEELDKLKASNWTVAEPLVAKKKIIKKKVNETKPKVVNTKKATDRPNFADFRKKLLEQQQLNQENDMTAAKAVIGVSDPDKTKTFDGGFFKVESPVRKVVETGSERRSGILEVGNTPKGTPLAQSLLQKMARKSLIISIQNCEKDSPMPSDSKMGHLETMFAEPETSVPVPLDGDHQTAPDVSYQTEPTEPRSRKSKRKSVSFSNVVTKSLDDDFTKYLLPSSSDDPQSPVVKYRPSDDPIQTSEKCDGQSLVGIDDDDVPVDVFKGLKLGFTPGTDKKSRRISSFTPLSNTLKVDGMDRICEQAELSYTDLMVFSPLKSDLLAEGEPSAKKDRKSQVQVRRSTRRSIADKARQSVL